MIGPSNLEARGEIEQENKILNRLKSIEGHVRGVQRMVEEDKYCIGILKQTLAVQRAFDKVNALILGNHFGNGSSLNYWMSSKPQAACRHNWCQHPSRF